MRLVLDANEYIFALGFFKKEKCESLLKFLIDSLPSHSISICRTIVEEVRTNLSPKEFQNFIKFINILTTIDEDFFVPFEIGVKYEIKGLKPSDAFIAGFAEWVGADAMVTENRHFLNRHPDLPFKVLSADKCLKLM